MTDEPLTPEEAMRAIPILLARIIELETAIVALTSHGYARKRPSLVDATPIRRQKDVP
jgi:hypothetical protein